MAATPIIHQIVLNIFITVITEEKDRYKSLVGFHKEYKQLSPLFKKPIEVEI